MKRNFYIFLCLSTILLVYTSCADDSSAETKTETVKPDSPELLAELENIIALDEKMMKAGQTDIKSIAIELHKKTHEFANSYPSHAKTPAVLEVCAKACEVLGKYDEAINILHKLIYEFPETDETPKYMWNKARVIEEGLGKIPNAKAAYLELVKRFPNHQMAIDANYYVENFLGKTDEEILKFLDANNNLSGQQ
jgi:tetratricopeptide (TPR) repeat protein